MLAPISQIFKHSYKSYDIILGRIRVAWHPNGEEEVVREKNVGLADRSLMPGDVVRRLIAGKDTQRGRILKMYIFRKKIFRKLYL